MKTILRLFLPCIFTIFLLISCWSFLSIDQPDLADPNSTFDVLITVALTPEEGSGKGYFGIRLPIGWTVQDSISFTGVLNGIFVYSSQLSDSMELFENSPNGYHWWIGVSDSVHNLPEGNISFTPRITTDEQSGIFFIDYIISDRIGEFSAHMVHSGPHLISVDAPKTLTVTNTNDSGEGSLRQVLSEISSRGEIVFDVPYPATITLDSQLVVDRSMIITGPESGELTISGNKRCRVLNIKEQLSVNVSNLTIAKGYVDNTHPDGPGGGINCINSDLSLENISITGNIVENGFKNDMYVDYGGGIYCETSNLRFSNVTITGNSAAGGGGGGIYCESSNLRFSNVTITGNSASGGGGIFFSGNSRIFFDNNNYSNIYHNTAAVGNDIYSTCDTIIQVVVDTFTVLNPTDYFACPLGYFNLDIQNAKINQSNTDLYVNSNGDNSNSGTSSVKALKTISFAFKKIIADSLNPRIIYIDDGIYSTSTNGEKFPLRIPSYVSLSGSSKEKVILDAEDQGAVIQIHTYTYPNWGGLLVHQHKNMIENLTITRGNASGIQCWGSSLNLNNVNIIENTNNGVRSDVNSDIWHYAGGITCGNAFLTLTHVTITNNYASRRGGGIHCDNSNADLSHVRITNNTAGKSGGGIYQENDIINLKDVSIAYNSAGEEGGGITASGSLIFDREQRCNIYSNHSGSGFDLNGWRADSIIEVIVDTFTVLNPTEKYAAPIQKFTFDILHDASGLTDISEEINNLPTTFSLNPNYPNPFNPSTTIEFSLPKSEFVELKIYNILGEEVAILVSEALNAGNYTFNWDARSLASGVYFYKIEAGNFVKIRKMIYLK